MSRRPHRRDDVIRTWKHDPRPAIGDNRVYITPRPDRREASKKKRRK